MVTRRTASGLSALDDIDADEAPLDWDAIAMVVDDREWRLGRKLRREEKVEVVRRLRACGAEWQAIRDLIGWNVDGAQHALLRATRTCPVCLRRVYLTTGKRYETHSDNARNSCPGSGITEIPADHTRPSRNRSTT